MYKQIKHLADEAIALQNKDRMDAVLREISDIAGTESLIVAMAAAQRDAIDTGTGMLSVSLSSDGELEAKHIPAAELRAEPAADPAPLTPDPAALTGKAKKGAK